MSGKRHLSGRSLRLLFALGILKGKGSGKNRTVTYDKARARTTSNLRKRGVDVTSRKRFRNTPGKSGRHVFGAKGAHLRGSGTGGKPKVDHSATRAARVAAGRAQAAKSLAEGRGLALVKAVSLHSAGRTKQATAAAQAAGINPRAVAGLGNRSRTTGRQGDLRRASWGEYSTSALSRERTAGRPITQAVIQANRQRWQQELDSRAFRKELKQAMKGIGPIGRR